MALALTLALLDPSAFGICIIRYCLPTSILRERLVWRQFYIVARFTTEYCSVQGMYSCTLSQGDALARTNCSFHMFTDEITVDGAFQALRDKVFGK